jgi:DeoR family transcriptional regulator, fructose operon transcriptional repressor
VSVWLVQQRAPGGNPGPDPAGKRVSVTSLAGHFAVVGETIRRDLADLESRGLIRRVHGGAIPLERVTFEPPIEARHDLMRPEKERIARAALAELPGEGSA